MPRELPEWTIVDFIHHGYWWRNHGILMLNLWLLLPLFTASVNGLDSSVLNGLQILPSWQNYFGHPSGKTLGLINSAQSIGGLIGLPFTPFVSDIFGRRATLFVGSIIMLAGVTLQVCATSVPVLIGARLLVGFGLTFNVNASPLLITELAYPTQRGKITSIFNTTWYVGSILSAWICFAAYTQAETSIWSWKVPTLIQAVVPLLQVIFAWFLPESPRFLVSKGLESQAAKTLAKYHANGGDERDPLIQFEMAQIRHALKTEREVSQTTSWRTLVATPGNRKRMRIIIAVAIFSQWSGNGLVSYYINLVLEGVGIHKTSTKAAINGGLQVFNFCVAMTGALLIDRVGRRKIFITSNIGMLIVFSMWTLTTALFNTSGNAASARATVPLIFLFYLFYDIAYTPLVVAYSLEILPYNIRARGFAVMNLTIYLTQGFNLFVNPWALDAISWKYYIVYCGWLVLELSCILAWAVETRGRTLEETAALFDGEQKPQDLMQMGGEAATITMNYPRTSVAQHPYNSYHDLTGSGSAEEKSRSIIKGTGDTPREPEPLDSVELQEVLRLQSPTFRKAERLDNHLHVGYASADAKRSSQKRLATNRDPNGSYSIFYDHGEEDEDDIRERIGQDTFCQSKDPEMTGPFSPTASSVLDGAIGRAV